MRQNPASTPSGGRAIRPSTAILFAAGLATSLVMVPTASATVSTTGDVSPDPSTTTLSDDIRIGNSANGSAMVDAGDYVLSEDTRLGSAFDNFSGTLTVDGVGSTWSANYNLIVLLGAVNIQNSGVVNVGFNTEIGTLGDPPNNTSLNLNSGTLNTRTLFSASTNLRGVGVVNANGLVSDFDITYNIANGLQQQVIFNNEPGQYIAVNLELNGTGILGIGHSSAGSLTVEQGVGISSNWGLLGYKNGSSAFVTVDGIGSRWDIIRDLRKEGQSDLNLKVLNGGVINAGDNISIGSTTTGLDTTSVLVSGPGSLIAGDGVFISGGGAGQLVTQDGGAISALNLGVGGTSTVGAGSILDGPSSTWSATLTFTAVGDVHARNMGQITTTNANVRSSAIGQSTVIDGAGTRLVASNILMIGDSSSSGRLEVINGGYVEALDLDSGTQFNGSPSTELIASGTGSEIKVLDRLRIITGSFSVSSGARLQAALMDSDVFSAITFAGDDTAIQTVLGARLNGTTLLSDGAAWSSAYVAVRDTLRIAGSETKLDTTDIATGLLVTGTDATVNQDGGMVTLAGDLKIAGLGKFNAPETGTYNLAGGLLDLAGNDIVDLGGNASFTFTGGDLKNVSHFGFNLTQQGGALYPGSASHSIGITTFTDDFINNAGTLAIDLGNQHDQVIVNGALTLGVSSTLDLALIDGFTPEHGDTFDIIDYTTRTGTFGSVQGMEVADDLALAVTYDDARGKVIVTAAYLGDANLDGEVSLLDLDILGQHYGNAGTWAQGDFNGDGQVSLIDLDILGQYYGDGTAPLSRSAMLAYIGQPVPEPSSLALIASGGLLLARRRRCA